MPKNSLSVFDYFFGLRLKGLRGPGTISISKFISFTLYLNKSGDTFYEKFKFNHISIYIHTSQPVFPWWNSTMKTPKQCVKSVLKLTIVTPEWRLTSFRCLYCQFWTGFSHCFGVSTVEFEHGNLGWVKYHR